MKPSPPSSPGSLPSDFPGSAPQGGSVQAEAASDLLPSGIKLQHILVPVDFSTTSVDALRYAVPLAVQFGAKLTLLNVLEIPSRGEDISLPVDAEATRALHGRKLDELVRGALPRGLNVETKVVLGSAFREIVAVATDLAVDLIVMSTHGHSGFKRVLLGSVAERVVRYAPCPVLVVR